MSAESAAAVRWRLGVPRLSATAKHWLLVLPAIVFVVGFYIFPMFDVGAFSFTKPEPGLGNYVELATSASARRVFWTTVRITTIAAFIAVAVGYVFALALTMLRQRVHKWLILAMILPMWISALIKAFSWLLLLGNNGVVNQALMSMGVPGAPFAFVRNDSGVIVGMVHYLIPYAVLPLYAAMEGIDTRQIWAARSLGSSSAYAVWKVFVPQTLAGIFGAFILVFIFGLGFFVTPAVLGGGKVLMASEYVSVLTLQIARWGLGAALAMVLLVFSIVLVLVMGRFMKDDTILGRAR